MRICFLMGSADISGGSLVIFEHALFARDAGHDVTMATLEPFDAARMQWHRATRSLRFTTMSAAAHEPYDLVIATWWRTIAELPKFSARHAIYFVQSIESRFYPETATPVRSEVDATYDVPLPCITEARWIKTWLESRHGRSVMLAPNGIDKSIFNLSGPAIAPRRPGHCRILVEGRLGVPFKNVARTIALARKSDADEIWLLTPTPLTRYPGVDRIFSRIPIEQTAAVYRSCDVLVKLSYVEGMFGPPLEMAHCGGTSIVYDVSGADEYLVNNANAIICHRDDEAGVIAAINTLKHQPAVRTKLVDGALATASVWPDWATSSATFLRAVETITAPEPAQRQTATPVAGHSALAPQPQQRRTPRRVLGALRRQAARIYLGSRPLNNLMALWWAAEANRKPIRKT